MEFAPRRLSTIWPVFFGKFKSITIAYGRSSRVCRQPVSCGQAVRTSSYGKTVEDLSRAILLERLGAGRESAWIRGTGFRGRAGVAVTQAGSLAAGLYIRASCLTTTRLSWLQRTTDTVRHWLVSFFRIISWRVSRRIDKNVRVADKTMLKVPFDANYWRHNSRGSGPSPRTEVCRSCTVVLRRTP